MPIHSRITSLHCKQGKKDFHARRFYPQRDAGLFSAIKKAGENITTQPAQQLNIKKGKYKVLI